jgi:hypothetical protein
MLRFNFATYKNVIFKFYYTQILLRISFFTYKFCSHSNCNISFKIINFITEQHTI